MVKNSLPPPPPFLILMDARRKLSSLQADTQYDASSKECFGAFTDKSRRVDWIVTSPPYKNVFGIIGVALRLARVGVALKLRLTFLEPTKTRGNWLKENPHSAVVVLPRATYRGRQCNSPEAWFVWHTRGGADVKPIGQAFFLRYRRVHRGVFS